MKTVLVIDDDAAVREAFELALEDLSYSVLSAAGGEEGLASLEKQRVDLVYLDLKMPVMDGVETLRRVRAMGCTAPVYVVTGFAEEFLSRLKEAEHDGLQFELLHKPLNRDQIREVTTGLLGDAQTEDKTSAADQVQSQDKTSARYVFRMYVVGRSKRTETTTDNLKAIFESDFPGQYELEVIDVLEHPQLAENDKILATPTVIRRLPEPIRRIIGDFSDKERVLLGLDLLPASTQE